MEKSFLRRVTFSLLTLLNCTFAFAQNPLIMNQFTADPSARVFGGRLYIYPSHDILPPAGSGKAGWFNMEDYHAFSSENLTDWTDYGVILSQSKVPWADSAAYSMWAPDCVERNGKYYFYFPTKAKEKRTESGFVIGVAVADKPYGPFVPQTKPIAGVNGIDPNVFIDKDGQAYLYWSQGDLYVAKLKSNMLELDGEIKVLTNLPEKGLKEGPYMFERNGIYYLTYPHVELKTERLEYAISNNPMGPFKVTGVIMKESSSGCWTNHHSVLAYKGQWYLFYHDNELSPNFDKCRSIRADSLFFNADGTIREVTPTLRGVGLTPANSMIQIDRYSEASKQGIKIDYLDTLNRMKGWKVVFNENKSWVRYNAVNFSQKKWRTITFKALSQQRGTSIEVRLNNLNGPVLARLKPNTNGLWRINKAKVLLSFKQKHDLFFVSKSNIPLTLDWIQFNL